MAEGQQPPLDAQQEGLQAEEGCLGDEGPRTGDQRGTPKTVVADWYVKISKKTSGQATKMLTEGETWVLQHCGFYKGQYI